MTTRSKLLVAALTATMVMAFAVSASGRRFEVSSQDFTAMWPALTFEDTGALGIKVICPVELEGSFHSRTLSKVSGQLVGYVTGATIRGETEGTQPPCTNGTATVLTEKLPWHVRYQSFSGTLPIINSITIQLVGAAFRIFNSSVLVTCLITTEATRPARAIITREGNNARNIRADEASIISGCGANVQLKGTGEVWQPAFIPTTRIRVTLVQ